MIKVAKFGGSSLADAEHFRKVKAIITADPDRHYVVDSAPGKRYKEDTKVTDLLILAYSNRHDAKAFDKVFKKIENRFNEIIVDLELDFSLDEEFKKIREDFPKDPGIEEVSISTAYS